VILNAPSRYWVAGSFVSLDRIDELTPFQSAGSPSNRNPIRTSTWKAGSPALFTEPRMFLTGTLL
jgi:hypothetical protein